jgi:hypothetical protein
MDTGLVVVLVVSGFFLLVPLVLAWASTSPRRWARVEGVLGRELAGKPPPRWLFAGWIVLGVLYLAMAVLQARTPERDGFPWFNLFAGVFWILNGGSQYLVYRRMRQRESAETQVERRAEPGRPGTGG